jgi:hypothetical protein
VISMGFCIAFRRDLNLQSRTSEIAGWGAGARRYPRTSLAFATVCPTVHYGESGCARTRGRLVLLDCKVLVISRTARDHPGNPAVVASPKWLRPTRLGPFSRPLGPTQAFADYSNFFRIFPVNCGAPLRNRTVDLLLTMETLCRLS